MNAIFYIVFFGVFLFIVGEVWWRKGGREKIEKLKRERTKKKVKPP